MALLEWRNEFSVGSEQMDNEHKKLFGLINDLDDAMKEGIGNMSFPHVFEQMKAYSIFHFTSEEKYLTEVNYPGLDNQKEAHKEFIAQDSDT